MDYKEKLETLIKYHHNLCGQIKAHGAFNGRGLNRTITKARKVEKQIELLLGINSGDG